MRYMSSVLLVFMASQFAVADDTPSPAAKQFKALVDEYEQEGGARTFSKRFLAFAEDHSKEPAAADALLWVVKNVRGRSDTTKALELLETNHIESEKLGPACGDIVGARSLAAEQLLRAVLERSPHADVRATACYCLAKLLDNEALVIDQLRAAPDLAPRVLQYYGQEYGKHLASLKPDELTKRREQVYETMLKSFPAVSVQGTPLGEISEKALFAIRHLSVGTVAPGIEGEEVRGGTFKLSDFRGNIVMLTFWGHW